MLTRRRRSCGGYSIDRTFPQVSGVDGSRTAWIRYALTIFLSAFLLFQVQPLIGKFILPWFGGSPAVWTTCMLFFQILLLGGYGYAHFVTSRLPPRRWPLSTWRCWLLSLGFLPIAPADAWKPTGSELPVAA